MDKTPAEKSLNIMLGQRIPKSPDQILKEVKNRAKKSDRPVR